MKTVKDTAFTGKHMLFIMLAFFAVVFTANMTMVYHASHSWTGLVVKNAYVASQQFNTETAAREKTEAGVKIVASYNESILRLQFLDDAGNALSATAVAVTLGRPTHEGEDQRLDLVSEGQGKYMVRQALAPGVWSGQVSAQIANHPGWTKPLRITVGG